jgi:radical SAM superfamily enzyme YgiQ (UPF0313 family)
MKVLLINPPFYRFLSLEQDYVPLSLLAVGSYMSAQGDDVYIKNLEVGDNVHYVGYSGRGDNYDMFLKAIDDDSHFVWQELHATIRDVRPDKIGINVLNVKYKSAMKIIEIAAGYNIPVVVGGNHPTTEPHTYSNGIEVFKGEFESGGGRIKNLDELPMPNYDLLMDDYSPNGYGHVLSARGCPFNCAFCASKIMWHRRVTFKSVDRIIKEMEYVYDRFGTDYFTFWDETFTIKKDRVIEFCDKYKLPAQWRCDTRADSITEDMLVRMKDAGCGQMSIGLESADPATLSVIGKNETVDDFKRAASMLNKHNIQWKAYMIIGFPSDTEEGILRSVEVIKELKPFRITLSYFTPYKGTELYDEVRELGLINETYDMSLFSHQSPHNYFCPKIPRGRYLELRKAVSEDIDDYNKKALETWK